MLFPSGKNNFSSGRHPARDPAIYVLAAWKIPPAIVKQTARLYTIVKLFFCRFRRFVQHFPPDKTNFGVYPAGVQINK
jgi:hypothetical protein